MDRDREKSAARLTRSMMKGKQIVSPDESTEGNPNDNSKTPEKKRESWEIALDELLAVLPEAETPDYRPHTTLVIETTPDSGTSLVPYETDECQLEITDERGNMWYVDWHNKARGDPHRRKNKRSDGWSHFLKSNGLKAGDIVVFRQLESTYGHILFGFDIMGRSKPPIETSCPEATPACQLQLKDHQAVERGYHSDSYKKKATPRYREAYKHKPYEQSEKGLKFHYCSDCSLGLYAPVGAKRAEISRFANAGWPGKIPDKYSSQGPTKVDRRSKMIPKRCGGKKHLGKEGPEEGRGTLQNENDPKRPRRDDPRPSKKRGLSKLDEGNFQTASLKQPRPSQTLQGGEGSSSVQRPAMSVDINQHPADRAADDRDVVDIPTSMTISSDQEGCSSKTGQQKLQPKRPSKKAPNQILLNIDINQVPADGDEDEEDTVIVDTPTSTMTRTDILQGGGSQLNANDVATSTGFAGPSALQHSEDVVELGPVPGSRAGPSSQPSDDNTDSTVRPLPEAPTNAGELCTDLSRLLIELEKTPSDSESY